MARFIKAYDEIDGVKFEIGVRAFSRRGARYRAITSLIGRRPAYVSAVKGVEVIDLDTGLLKDYRVIIKLEYGEDLRSKIKMQEALDYLGRED